MRRREFIGWLAGAAVAAPLAVAAEGQPSGRMYRIGYLLEAAEPESASLMRALEEGLRELGYREGSNLVIERHFAAFQYDRLPDLAAELVQLKPEVIVASSNPSVAAALKQATTAIPIVIVAVTDPVGAGLVTNLARPGDNITGLTVSTGPELRAKQLEILNEIVPKLSRVAILRQWGLAGAESAALEPAARKLGWTIQFMDVRGPSDIEGAFATMTRNRTDAFLILGGGLTYTFREQIANLAIQDRLPGIHLNREYAQAGLLVTYGPNLVVLWQRAATYVDKILKGAKPGDLPVEQPTQFELVINLKTAKALAIEIPPLLLARADEVIE
jgi:putative ABC transport system substrate-binding protein